MSRIATFLAAIVITLSIFQLRSCSALKEAYKQRDSYGELIDLEKRKAKIWRDKEGRSRARAESAEATIESVQRMIPEILEENDGLKREKKSLENYITSSLSSSGSIETILRDTITVTDKDTVYVKSFSYTDKWSRFDGLIDGSKVSLDYSVRDSITFFQYYRGKTFFKKGKLVVDGISHNPNTTITGLQNIKIIEPRKRNISLGPTFSYGVTSTGEPTFSVGVGVQWKWIEF